VRHGATDQKARALGEVEGSTTSAVVPIVCA
jgi:hypothetical protein